MGIAADILAIVWIWLVSAKLLVGLCSRINGSAYLQQVVLHVPHSKNYTAAVGYGLEMVDDELELVYSLELTTLSHPGFIIGYLGLPPPITVGPIEGLAIVAIVSDVGVVVGKWGYVVTTGQHPEGFVEMKEWVAVPSLVEQHSLLGVSVGDNHGLLDVEHVTVTAGRSP